MAKMFYTVDEVKTMLGLDDKAVRAMIQQGKLRELHDGPRRVFKANEVETLASQMPPKPPAGKAGDASSFTLEMADSTAAGASGPRSGDTALRAAEPAAASDADQLNLSDTEAVAKPSASAESDGGVLQLEGAAGSGSGLLDLTREGDDTSLGAVLDEIYPSEEETTAGVTGLGSGVASGLGTGLASALTPALTEPQIAQPAMAEADRTEQADLARAAAPFTAAMILAAILLALAFSALAAVLQGIMPAYLRVICNNLLYFLIGSIVAAAVVFIVAKVLRR